MNDYNVYEDHDHWGWLAQPVISFGLLCFTILMLLCSVSSATAATADTTDTSVQLMFSYQADLSDAQVLQGATVHPQPVYLFMQNASGYRGVRYLCCDAARSGTEQYVSNAPLFTQSYDFTGQTPGDKGVYLDEYTSAGYQKREVTFTLGSAASSDYPPGYVFLEGKGNLNVSGSGTGNEYWVDINNPLANDDSAGTKDAPWKTFSHAVKTATAGDTVYVMPGVYEDPEETRDNYNFYVENSGEPGNPITFKSVVRGGAVLKSRSVDNSVTSEYKALSVQTKHDIIFDGFKTIGLVLFRSTNRVNFINGEVTVGSLLWDIGQKSLVGGIILEKAHNSVIRNNKVHSLAPVYKNEEQLLTHNQAAINIYGSVDGSGTSENNLIEYNEIDASHNVYAGLGTKGGWLKNNVWRNNLVKNAKVGIYSTGTTVVHGDDAGVTSDSTYTQNILVNNQDKGIEFNYSVINAMVSHNTIVNSKFGFWFTALNSTNMTLKNNLISNATSVYRAQANWGVIEGERERFYQMFSAMDGNHYDQYQRFSFQEKSVGDQGHLIHSSLADFQAEAPALEVNAVETPVDFVNPDGDSAEDFRPYATTGEISAGAYTTAETIVGTY